MAVFSAAFVSNRLRLDRISEETINMRQSIEQVYASYLKQEIDPFGIINEGITVPLNVEYKVVTIFFFTLRWIVGVPTL